MNVINSLIKSIGITVFLFSCLTLQAGAQYSYENESLSDIITHIETNTNFHFLYRDALITGIRLSLNSTNESLFVDLDSTLHSYNLTVKVDSARHQAIIVETNQDTTSGKKLAVQGYVVDAKTGERLPYATIQWRKNGNIRGTSANQSGAFSFTERIDKQQLELQSSYVGYAPKTITLDLSENHIFSELTFRLVPKRIDGNELIVTGSNKYNDINDQELDLVDMGTFSPLGESNSLRALQNLPSVSVGPAMSNGLNVRGSPADGVQVLLDDIPIYNQSHLFGLVDSFNADILKRSGFYYDIAPAQFQAPPGGTLSLITKTGSLQEFAGSAGVSNTSARFSLEGPIKKGHSSWLISARTSYMNTLDWLNNSDLVSWGLNVDREREVLSDDLVEFESQLVKSQSTDASFFDIHGKTYFEQKNGSRIIISGYLGGDDTQQNADRLYRTFSPNNGIGIEERDVTTTNDWQNFAGSVQYHQQPSQNLFSGTTVGTSIYRTSFSKDDFTYIDINASTGALQSFVFPFENESVLNEVKLSQQFEFEANNWDWNGGLSYHYYFGEYSENSFEQPGFFSSRKSHQIDAYTQIDYRGIHSIDLYGGSRVHYYSNGKYLRWSPRIKLTLFPKSALSISGGYSKNHQFLSNISLSNTITSDIWILSDDNQPPISVSYFSSGIYYDASEWFYLQAEAYVKEFSHLRLHETNAYSLGGSFNNNPWYSNNDGKAKGIEFLLKNQWRFFALTQTFALSEMVLTNPQINNGQPFYPDWDRTYTYNLSLELRPINKLTLYLSWIWASGTPNKLATFGADNEQRLGTYQRTDFSAEYQQDIGQTNLSVTLSIFNLWDRQNPWYRELSFIIDQSGAQDQFRSIPVTVYDLGFQPSFNISLNF